MVVVRSYALAVFMCVITMLCWGSWANTQKLASAEWPFQLYYWDYSIGVLLLSLVLAFSMGSLGKEGRGFLADLGQASRQALFNAFIGGVIFNLANILLVAALAIAGMAVAFPVGVGLALVLGVLSTYLVKPEGNPVLLALGVLCITVAIVVDAIAYGRLAGAEQTTPVKGVVVAVIAGLLMGFFYRFVVASLVKDFANPEPGRLTPYTAIVLFSLGLFLSNFVWNTIIMVKPISGEPVPFGDYFSKGNLNLHLLGILGGIIWNIGMSFSIIASEQASPAVAYGLGQGATMVAAAWGVFIWKEFRNAPPGTEKLLAAMFAFYLIGLAILVAVKLRGQQPQVQAEAR